MTAFTVETEHHVVEFDDKPTYKAWKKYIKNLGVTPDYYMFEFDVEEQLFPEVDDVVINNLMEDADDARGHYEEIDDEE